MKVSPVGRLTFSILSVMLSLVFIGVALGLVPNNEQNAIQMRADTAENLALQVASLAGRNEIDAVTKTFTAMVNPQTQVVSAGLRKADGSIVASSPEHETIWARGYTAGTSDATHVVIPLMNEGVAEANIEIMFEPPTALFTYFGLSEKLLVMVGFLAIAGAFGFYFMLHRSLRELEPGSAFPERVTAAFNTLASGVLLIDENRTILLANKVFESTLHESGDPLTGRDINDLQWVMTADTRNREFPWEVAVRSRQPVLGFLISLRRPTGLIAKLVANATPIVNGEKLGGVMITFEDVTMLHQKNEQLNSANAELREIKNQVTAQNEQLRVLASIDGLTGCLNRRTFFVEAENMLKAARASGHQLSALMLDIDHFKSINDIYGHPAGDAVLTALGQMLRNKYGNLGIVGRYGGEEFCVLFAGVTAYQVRELAEQLRNTVSAIDSWLPDGKAVTVSMGFAMLAKPDWGIAEVIKVADQALYKAKRDGRNRVVEGKDLVAEAA